MADVAPLLSICLPTFNRAWMLRRNLEFHLAAFRLRGLAFEIVVVDDCSTDDTADYLGSLAGVAELSVFRRHKNSGFLDNYAFAMQRARGRYAVFLGDDDLLVPDQIMACLAILEGDATIGVIQAPWLLIDERPEGGELGPFYRIPGPTRIARSDHAALSRFIFDFHVFPEFMILRRDVVARSISASCPFIFWAFLFTGRALDHGDILFLPTPFARVTAVSADPRVQQGNRETMFQWDHYLGGIEYIAARAQRAGAVPFGERGAMMEAITRFMAVRKSVALRLLVGERHWIEAYVLIHRLTAYQPLPVSAEDFRQISFMAALTAAVKDAASFAAGPVLVDPRANRTVLDLLRSDLRERLRFADSDPGGDGPCAYLQFAPGTRPDLRPGDAVFTVSDYMAQFG